MAVAGAAVTPSGRRMAAPAAASARMAPSQEKAQAALARSQAERRRVRFPRNYNEREDTE